MVDIAKDWAIFEVGTLFEISVGGDLELSSYSRSYDATHQYPIWTNSANPLRAYGYTSHPKFPAGCLTVSGRGTIGVTKLRTVPFDAIIRMLVLRPKEIDSIWPKYFEYVLSELESPFVESTGVPQLTAPKLSKMRVSCPSFQEQRAIAEVLSGFDEHLANLDALIAKKKAIRDGALEDLVSGTRRIPGFSQPWRVINFAEEIIPKARIGWQGLKAGEYLRSGYSLLISGTDFEDGHVSAKKISFVSKERYEMDTAIQVQAGDVLVTKDGTIGKVALVPDLGMPATLNSGVFVFRPHSSLAREFLYWVLMSSVFRAFINTLAAGSTIKHLYQKDLTDFSFSAPSTESEQISISEALFAMDSEIASLVEERTKVERLKQGAMEDLLTGRVRLPVHEEAS